MAASTGTLSHRQASGLVRAGKPLDAALFNFFGATFGPVIAWVLLYGVGFYPGSSLLLSILITFALCLGMNLSYAFFAAIMPRSGGDYVFISRTFHPFLGFVVNSSFVIWLTFYIGTAGALFGQLGLGPAFRVVAAASGEHGLASVGEWFDTDWGKFLSGIAMMALTGPVVLAGRHGLRGYFKFQRVVFIVAAALLLVTVVAMVIMGSGGFHSSFDAYSAKFTGQSGAYNAVVSEGGGHGGFDFKQTLLACTWPFYGAAFLVQSAYWAGEARTGLRSQLVGITLPFVLALVVLLVVVSIGLNVFGVDFLAGLAVAEPSLYGASAAPYFAELTATWTGPIIGVAITLGLGAWLISYVPFIAIMNTRSMLAWSLDGIAPAWLGKVDPGSANPVNATLVTFVCGIAFLAIYSFTTWLSVASALFAFAITFFVASIAAAAFPFLRRRLFNGSPGDVRVGGIPVMAIAGVFGTFGLGVMIWVLLNDPSSGISWDVNRGNVIAAIVIFAVAAVTYLVSAFVRRRQGVDLAASYRTLPPE